MAKKASKESALLDLMSDAKTEDAPSNNALEEVSKLAEQQATLIIRVARAEDELKAAKEVLRLNAEVDLPEAMRAAGCMEFTTTSKLKVKLTDTVQCAISVANREAAYVWLADNGFGGLLKGDVDISFGCEEFENADKLVERLRDEGFVCSLTQSVHAQTLKAFVKEQLANPESAKGFPLDLFGARPYTVATVKACK